MKEENKNPANNAGIVKTSAEKSSDCINMQDEQKPLSREQKEQIQKERTRQADSYESFDRCLRAMYGG